MTVAARQKGAYHPDTIAAELSGRRPSERIPTRKPSELIPVDPEWVTIREALAMLGLSQNNSDGGWKLPRGVNKNLNGLETRTHDSGKVGRRLTIFRRKDIERAAVLRREAGLSARSAISMVVAENEGRV